MALKQRDEIKNSSTTKEKIFVFSAHSDDFVLGVGGTIAKYAKQGKEVYCFVFSYGELLHPLTKVDAAKKMRYKEAVAAAEILGCKVLFFDLKEMAFLEEVKTKGAFSKLLSLLKRHRPSKLFTHSIEDPHPDHKAVQQISLELFEKLAKKDRPDLYVYSVWNPVDFKTKYPALYEDISKTYSQKVEAIKAFPSQIVYVLYPIFMCFFRALRDGLAARMKLAEKFYLIRQGRVK